MVSHYINAEEYEKSAEIIEDFTTDLSSQGATEMASALKMYVNMDYICTVNT